jgi:hypothetical protein
MELVRLIHQIDERECVQRNALANTPTGFELSAGAVGTVVDTFGNSRTSRCRPWDGRESRQIARILQELSAIAPLRGLICRGG